MSGLREYRRDVIALLKDDYGVGDVTIVAGTNHPRLKFKYDGEEHTITLPNKVFGPTAFDMKRQDIRRLLGPPTTGRIELQHTVKEETMSVSEGDFDAPRVVPHNPDVKIWDGSVSALALSRDLTKTRLIFTIPAALSDDEFGWVGGLDIIMIDDESWEITANPNRKRPTFYHSSPNLRRAVTELVSAGGDRWASSPAQYMLTNGTILVHCPKASRKLLPPAVKPPVAVSPKPLPNENGVDENFNKQYARPRRTPTAMKTDRVKTTLDEIRRIEAETPYRLVKRAGKWVFVAPVIG